MKSALSNARSYCYQKCLVLACVGIVANSIGCVSVMHRPIDQACIAEVSQSDCQPCELYDRGELIARYAEAAAPRNWLPQPIVGLGAKTGELGTSCCGAATEWCARKKQWIEKKKAEANAPPWPSFHPVPTRPVFSPQQAEGQPTPEAYGRFGAGQ
jgi:hypothetical protein